MSSRARPIQRSADYIQSIMNKIEREKSVRLNYLVLSKTLAGLHDSAMERTKVLWSIVGNTSSDHTRVTALKEIRENEHSLLEAMFNAGVFQRKLGKLEVDLSGKRKDELDELLRRNRLQEENHDPETPPKNYIDNQAGR
jgi:hypothetical protein